MGVWFGRLPPLRVWLQSSSLLAVLAGYGLLLLFNQQLSDFQRRAMHRQLVAELAAEIQREPNTLRSPMLPGVRLQVTPSQAGQPQPDREWGLQANGQQWLVSRISLAMANGSRGTLQVQQNVTASVQQEWLGFWLLVVAAGLSSLFTSGLLRLVLKRGLVRPLAEFTKELSAIQAPPTPAKTINLCAQPEELRPIAEAFNDLQERLQASWERQRSFVDGVAHELRTPITLISGHAQSLLRRVPDDQALQLIYAESNRMATLVSDLLDLARQDSGRLMLRSELIVGEDVLLTLYERLSLKAAGRLKLALEAAESVSSASPTGIGDFDRVQQCLTTLVDNALQYSDDALPVSLYCSTSQAGELVLHVRDQGPGVAENERELIFERFVRGSAAQLSHQRGSGIGLSVVKLLMNAMGGRVLVADAPGGGSDFQLWLPPATPSQHLLSA